eukprot:TRINITY_DN99526_c0_g1_i1.p1 TRINITY_DN99526_c0_g1~~TRINITY_DN99526_c0_g1_i1.p1  ORF type:complete len:156 (-),score=34.43 TRINITY_DN99526_c0_g1_i1:70-471(-)
MMTTMPPRARSPQFAAAGGGPFGNHSGGHPLPPHDHRQASPIAVLAESFSTVPGGCATPPFNLPPPRPPSTTPSSQPPTWQIAAHQQTQQQMGCGGTFAAPPPSPPHHTHSASPLDVLSTNHPTLALRSPGGL